MTIMKMSTRGRLTIPKKIRDELGLKPGDRVTFISKEGCILMEFERENLNELLGSVPVDGQQDIEKVREDVKLKTVKKRGR